MRIYIYAKTTESTSQFDDIISQILDNSGLMPSLPDFIDNSPALPDLLPDSRDNSPTKLDSDPPVDNARHSNAEIFISIENRRSFRELENIKSECSPNDIIIISDISILGINDVEVANQLEFFKTKSVILIIKNIPSTYEYGIGQPMNQAVLSTLLLSVLNSNKKIKQIPFDKRPKSNAGRNRIEFPDNWDELYEEWQNKKISSKEFIQKTGLKKATFYNMMTEYKEIQRINNEYIKRYTAK